MKKIGVIDSGVGGLTILFDVVEKYPNNKYYYIGDSKNCPYGEKTNAQIKNYSYNLVKYLVDNYNIDILVIACNSISAVATSYLRKNFSNLNIIEVIKPTVQCVSKNSKKIGVIATNATINSNVYKDNLKKYEVYQKAIPEFVRIVENNIITDKERVIIYDELKELIDKKIDTLILGCTHFPLLKDEIKKIYDGNIVVSSSGIINKLNFLEITNELGEINYFTTGDNKHFDEQIKNMFNKDIDSKTIEFKKGYYIELNNFEGPLDLLLHLIKESDIKIEDINLNEVTNKYIEYIKFMEDLNITIASEYLVMAANLLELKSKSLLPHSPLEILEDTEEVEKFDLVNKLLEYEKYKNISKDFVKLKQIREEVHSKQKSNLSEYTSNQISIIDNLSVNLLVEAIDKLRIRIKENKPLATKITKKELSVVDKCNSIRNILKTKDKVLFNELFETYSKKVIITTFLSLLELIKSNEIIIKQDNNFNDILITRKDD